MATVTRLGEYLRTRRERVRPGDVGLPAGDRRRVPGLRREEVALLAGISAEYYLRLEQGRDQHPSDQVIDSIARALRLDADEKTYLHELARPPRRPGDGPPARAREPERPELDRQLDDALLAEILAALVQGRYLSTLAANKMAIALSPYFAPGVNTMRAAFLEPEMREFYRDWDEMTAKAVSFLRSVIGNAEDDPRLAQLVGDLSLRSERFRMLWARQDVRRKTSGLTKLLHPQVGPLDLLYEKLILPGAPGQLLVTYHAEPGSPSHEKLQLLALLA